MQEENKHFSDYFVLIRLAYENTDFLTQENQARYSFQYINLYSFSGIEWLPKRKITINGQLDIPNRRFFNPRYTILNKEVQKTR